MNKLNILDRVVPLVKIEREKLEGKLTNVQLQQVDAAIQQFIDTYGHQLLSWEEIGALCPAIDELPAMQEMDAELRGILRRIRALLLIVIGKIGEHDTTAGADAKPGTVMEEAMPMTASVASASPEMSNVGDPPSIGKERWGVIAQEFRNDISHFGYLVKPIPRAELIAAVQALFTAMENEEAGKSENPEEFRTLMSLYRVIFRAMITERCGESLVESIDLWPLRQITEDFVNLDLRHPAPRPVELACLQIVRERMEALLQTLSKTLFFSTVPVPPPEGCVLKSEIVSAIHNLRPGMNARFLSLPTGKSKPEIASTVAASTLMMCSSVVRDCPALLKTNEDLQLLRNWIQDLHNSLGNVSGEFEKANAEYCLSALKGLLREFETKLTKKPEGLHRDDLWKEFDACVANILDRREQIIARAPKIRGSWHPREKITESYGKMFRQSCPSLVTHLSQLEGVLNDIKVGLKYSAINAHGQDQQYFEEYNAAALQLFDVFVDSVRQQLPAPETPSKTLPPNVMTLGITIDGIVQQATMPTQNLTVAVHQAIEDAANETTREFRFKERVKKAARKLVMGTLSPTEQALENYPATIDLLGVRAVQRLTGFSQKFMRKIDNQGQNNYGIRCASILEEKLKPIFDAADKQLLDAQEQKNRLEGISPKLTQLTKARMRGSWVTNLEWATDAWLTEILAENSIAPSADAQAAVKTFFREIDALISSPAVPETAVSWEELNGFYAGLRERMLQCKKELNDRHYTAREQLITRICIVGGCKKMQNMLMKNCALARGRSIPIATLQCIATMALGSVFDAAVWSIHHRSTQPEWQAAADVIKRNETEWTALTWPNVIADQTVLQEIRTTGDAHVTRLRGAFGATSDPHAQQVMRDFQDGFAFIEEQVTAMVNLPPEPVQSINESFATIRQYARSVDPAKAQESAVSEIFETLFEICAGRVGSIPVPQEASSVTPFPGIESCVSALGEYVRVVVSTGRETDREKTMQSLLRLAKALRGITSLLCDDHAI